MYSIMENYTPGQQPQNNPLPKPEETLPAAAEEQSSQPNSQTNWNNPPESPEVKHSENPEPKKKKWIGVLSLAVIVIAVLHFAGLWSWIGDKLAPNSISDEQNIESITEIEDFVEKTSEGEGEGETVSEVMVGKGKVTFVISAGFSQGASLTSGNPDENLEIRKVYLWNSSKDSWLLVYEGSRPLDLMQLSATGEKHVLLETNLAALDYTQVRIEFADLLTVSQRDGKVARERVVDMSGVVIKEGEDNIINIWFNLDDINQPIPSVI